MAEGHLPVRLSSFIGRESELAELVDLVRRHRLVTLTGPGGGGKTRLALTLADRLRPAYDDRVRWAGLADLTGPAAVLSAVADALELPEATEQAITGRLAGQPILLVVDNCEHLLDPVARLIRRLLRACPELTVLATSQQPLGNPGELVFAVPPLGAEAGTLFVERARAASYGFEQTDANAADIALICQRLDGVPLAIELAAAWVPALSPAQIAHRLDDSLRVLTGGDREAMPRHRTLRGALDWSWNLLAEPEQSLLAQLAVFPGGFTVDAVEAVADLGEADVLHSLSQLVNRSLVMVQQGDEVRYRLLQTVRQYAAEQLAGDTGPARRQAQYVLELTEQAAGKLEGEEQQEWLDLLGLERQNIWAAHRWFLQSGEVESVARLAVGVWWACYLLGRYGEVREWLEEVLRLPAELPITVRAEVLVAAGTLAHLQGDAAHAERRLRAGFAAYREAGDPAVEAMELHWLGGVAMRRGEYDEARRIGERCLELWRSIGNEAKYSRALDYQGMRELLAGELDHAEELVREARARYDNDGDSEGFGWATMLLGGVAHYRGERQVARALLTEARERSETTRQLTTLAWSLQLLGAEALRDRELDEADRLLDQSLRLHNDAGNRWRVASSLEGLAGVAVARSEVQRAVRLVAHAALIRERLGVPVPAVERADVSAVIEAAREAVPPAEYRGFWAEGEMVTLEKLLGEEPTARPAAAPLTIAESRVEPLRIVALGGSEVRRNEAVLDAADWGYAKPRELFFYLLGSGPVRKDQIGAELWPDASATSLRNSFHSCLHQLRRTLGRPDWVTFRRGRYEFNHSLDHTYDVTTFETTTDLQQAIDLYQGEYLADLGGSLWIETRRQSLHQRFEQALFQLAQTHTSAGHTAEAITLYELAITHDPLLESAHRALIELHLTAGNRAQAVRQYNLLATHLADELDTVPSAQTTALIRP
ncbi:BTAD domain-containing putative transcriptional regulator [Streptomyces sp. SID13031]|uniref:BTAD domain-containing putative transcriptional regulator n=1 Tax=Streptomyces sp. SID13031 TaxID=2706046 RepID=UPI0013CA29D9|nr:BTAD domain-containing putative transcriptional regulator [Streptomyces sp. SID13031]NEA31368.1 tetratricopeptide repeat protein [Streptomyces sp. SID13031]